MKSWLVEIMIILAVSKRTQWAIIFGIVAFAITILLGHHLVASLALQKMPLPFLNALRTIIEYRYKSIAWGELVTFLLLAYKFYKIDRRRFLFLSHHP